MGEMPVTGWWTVAIAAYAAVVATGALALEVRRWFESGARISINLMPEAETLNVPGTEGNIYLVATVTNRGNSPTTITHFAMRDYGSWIGRIRRRSKWNAFVASPQPPGAVHNLPSILEPGEVWSGLARYDEEGNLKRRIRGGYVYVAIYASHADKPTLQRVCVPAEPPQDSEKI